MEQTNQEIIKFWKDVYINTIRSGRGSTDALYFANRAIDGLASEFNIEFEDEKKHA